ncbi:MAG: lytic transglycosylase domain-containing protein [Acidobacteria bacterium]|nr:lytic transglycosylase domain-containing protein [Acidobacteriota bacterium]MBV9479847.1 lytic transglycosylase domain-containing protein [Acidobacteriota bacterium]
MLLRHKIVLAVLLLSPLCCSASDVAILRNGFSIPHTSRQAMGNMIRLYTAADKSSYVDIPVEEIERFETDLSPVRVAAAPLSSTSPPSLQDVIQGASDKQLLDVDLVNSVIRAESGFNANAVSPKGARGLMQLMPSTASTLGISNSFDPKQNVEGGTQYLRWLLDRYNYDLGKALAAYNAGPHRVEQYHGIPPYSETRAYVARIIRDFNRQKLAERKAIAATAKPPKTSAAPHSPSKTTDQTGGSR